MFDIPALLFRLWLPVVAIWMTSSALVALVFERMMNTVEGDGRLELNVWLVIAAQGAGAGGLIGTFPVLHQLVSVSAAAGAELGRLLLYIGVGTICGAACSCALVAAIVEIRRR